MSALLDQIKDSVSGLSDAERAELARYLIDSLEPEEEGVTQAWHDELVRRLSDIRSGKVVGKPVEQVLAKLREGYP